MVTLTLPLSLGKGRGDRRSRSRSGNSSGPSQERSGAPEPDNAHVDAPIYAAHQWILKEVGKPRARALFMYYNFCRIHQTLRVTPAMEAGIADHIWSIDEMIALLP